MIARIAALLVFLSMVVLLKITFDMTGPNAIMFIFVGHPLLLGGVLLAVVALARRLARERADGRYRSARWS